MAGKGWNFTTQQPLPALPSQPSDVAVLPVHDYHENLHNIKFGGFKQETGQSSRLPSLQ